MIAKSLKFSSCAVLSLCASILAIPGFAAGQTHTAPAPVAAHLDPAYGRLPMSFEPNRGQTDPSVRFLARGSHYTVLLQPARATLVLSHSDAAAKGHQPAAATRVAVHMTLEGANANAAIAPERPLPGHVTYMTGRDSSRWQVGLPTYAAARVAQPYPGIDLVYYGTERQLEYDFVVAPSADPSLIHLAIDGAQPVLEPSGELRLQLASTTRESDIVLHKPVLYQQNGATRTAVDGAFTLARNGDIGFQVGSYDHARELVIDPIISYGSYYGGSLEDEVNATALNASNQLYAAGQTLSPTLPSSTGEFGTAYLANKGGFGAFVTKFSADGSSVLWTTYLEGTNSDYATGIAVNSSDQAYVVGFTNSCGYPDGPPNTSIQFPFTSDAVQPLCSPISNYDGSAETNGTSNDAFLVKLSSDGKTELYGTPLGGSQDDQANSVVLDAAGQVYIVGTTNSTQYCYRNVAHSPCPEIPQYPVDNHGNAGIGLSNFPTTSNAFYTNTTESKMYATTDSNGNIAGPQDEQAFLTVLSADLHTLVYSSLIGGTDLGNCGNGYCNTNGYAVAVSNTGKAFIGGNTSSAHWPTTSGAFSTTCENAGTSTSICPLTGWLAGFDPTKSGNNSLLFSTYITGASGGTNASGGNIYPQSDLWGLATDSKGNVVATGDTFADDFPTTAGTLAPTCALPSGDGNGDSNICSSAFVTKLSPSGATVWSTLYTGTSFFAGAYVTGESVTLDKDDNVYVLGGGNVNTVPVKNSIAPNPQGGDAFLFELAPDASKLLMGTWIGATGGVQTNYNSLHLDSDLNAYFGGYQIYVTNGNQTLPTTPGAFATTGLGGRADGWVLKMITQQQPTSTALVVSTASATPSDTVTLTATVTDTSTLTGIPTTPTGTVNFMNGSTVVESATLTASGKAVYSGTIPTGNYTLTAVYAGDSGFNGSTSSSSPLDISSSVSTATTLVVSPSTATFGQSVTLTSTTLSGSSPANGGSVTFTAGTTTLGTATVNASGVATVTVTPPVGTYAIIASYTGTATTSNPTGTGNSASVSEPLVVAKATPTVALTVTPGVAAVGSSVSFSATVASSAGTPSGSVGFYNGTTLLGSGTLASGKATFSTSTLAAATYTVTAKYAGDTSFTSANGSSSTTLVVRVPAATTTTISSSNLSANGGSSVTLTATIASTVTTGTPTGTVDFFDGTSNIGSGTVSANTATLAISTLAAGSHSITAVYEGDSLFLTSTSSSITQVVIAPSLALSATPNPLTIARGKTGTTTLTFTPTGGYSGTVSLACSGLPAHAACSFAPASVTIAGAVVTDVVTITTEGSQASLVKPQLSGHDRSLSFAGLLMPVSLFALLGLARRKRLTQSLKGSLLLLVLFCGGLAASTALTGCGSSTPTAAPGTYNVVITATPASGSAQTLTVSVVIQ